jgi:hypothetical protein
MNKHLVDGDALRILFDSYYSITMAVYSKKYKGLTDKEILAKEPELNNILDHFSRELNIRKPTCVGKPK